MKIYWIKAQAPRRVLALVKHLGLKAELIEGQLIACTAAPQLVIDEVDVTQEVGLHLAQVAH